MAQAPACRSRPLLHPVHAVDLGLAQMLTRTRAYTHTPTRTRSLWLPEAAPLPAALAPSAARTHTHHARPPPATAPQRLRGRVPVCRRHLRPLRHWRHHQRAHQPRRLGCGAASSPGGPRLRVRPLGQHRRCCVRAHGAAAPRVCTARLQRFQQQAAWARVCKAPCCHVCCLGLAGESPNWQLERLEVVDTCSGRTYVFPCGKWLGKDKVRRPLALGPAVLSSMHACTYHVHAPTHPHATPPAHACAPGREPAAGARAAALRHSGGRRARRSARWGGHRARRSSRGGRRPRSRQQQRCRRVCLDQLAEAQPGSRRCCRGRARVAGATYACQAHVPRHAVAGRCKGGGRGRRARGAGAAAVGAADHGAGAGACAPACVCTREAAACHPCSPCRPCCRTLQAPQGHDGPTAAGAAAIPASVQWVVHTDIVILDTGRCGFSLQVRGPEASLASRCCCTHCLPVRSTRPSYWQPWILLLQNAGG